MRMRPKLRKSRLKAFWLNSLVSIAGGFLSIFLFANCVTVFMWLYFPSLEYEMVAMFFLFSVPWYYAGVVIVLFVRVWRRCKSLWKSCVSSALTGCAALLGVAATIIAWWPNGLDSLFRNRKMPIILAICVMAHPVVVLLMSFPFWVWRKLRQRFGQAQFAPECPQCLYNLTGNISMTCPECGRPFTLDELDQTPESWANLTR